MLPCLPCSWPPSWLHLPWSPTRSYSQILDRALSEYLFFLSRGSDLVLCNPLRTVRGPLFTFIRHIPFRSLLQCAHPDLYKNACFFIDTTNRSSDMSSTPRATPLNRQIAPTKLLQQHADEQFVKVPIGTIIGVSIDIRSTLGPSCDRALLKSFKEIRGRKYIAVLEVSSCIPAPATSLTHVQRSLLTRIQRTLPLPSALSGSFCKATLH